MHPTTTPVPCMRLMLMMQKRQQNIFAAFGCISSVTNTKGQTKVYRPGYVDTTICQYVCVLNLVCTINYPVFLGVQDERAN